MTDALCLSNSQIRTDDETTARLEVFTDGSFGKVTRELERRQCVECDEPFLEVKRRIQERCFGCRKIRRICIKCHGEFLVTNKVFRENDVIFCGRCGAANPGMTHGEITRFSESSKRHLMQWLNKIQRDCSLACFVTLTYPDEFFPLNQDPDRWKEDLRKFEMRFLRAFPEGTYVWRIEFEDRKSGDYIGEIFPHFHLLTFGVHLPDLRAFVAENWYEIAGCGNPEHLRVLKHRDTVTPVMSRRGVMAYAAKAVGSVMSRELAKSLQAKGQNVGRWWGIVAREVFKTFLSKSELLELTDEGAISLMRCFRKYIQAQTLARWRDAGRRWRKPPTGGFQWRSVTVFLNGTGLRNNFSRMLSPPGVWAYVYEHTQAIRVRTMFEPPGWWLYKSTGRPYDKPFLDFVADGGLL